MRIVGEPVGDDFSVTLIDITQRKRNEDKMLADALRDPLTSVLNRRGFEKEGAACIKSNEEGAVLYLDLNHFKSINDRFGHQAGDALLESVRSSPRVLPATRRHSRPAWAATSSPSCCRVSASMMPSMSQSAWCRPHQLPTSRPTSFRARKLSAQPAWVRISLMPKHGEELWHLISVADQAMYNAKSMSQGDEAANDPAAYIEAATKPPS